jgi:hypothetical protein
MRIIIKCNRNLWRLGLVVTVGIACALAAALGAPAFRGFVGFSRQSAAQNTVLTAPNVPPADLIVSEASFAGPAERRCIAGVLKNQSDKTYTNIQMTFSLVGDDGDRVGSATVMVGQIGAHGAAKFETTDVPPKAVEIVLEHIKTQPPMAGAP